MGAFSPDRKSLPADAYPFLGMYRGIVISVNDPEQAGRAQVRIYPFYLRVKDENLPWAVQALPVSSSRDTQILNVGDMVYCFFEAGDMHFPVVWAKTFAKQDGKPTSPVGTFEKPLYKEQSVESFTVGGEVYTELDLPPTRFGQVSVEDDTPGEVKEKYKSGEVIRFMDKFYIRKRHDGSITVKHRSLLGIFKEWVAIKAGLIALDADVRIGSAGYYLVSEDRLSAVVSALQNHVHQCAPVGTPSLPPNEGAGKPFWEEVTKALGKYKVGRIKAE